MVQGLRSHSQTQIYSHHTVNSGRIASHSGKVYKKPMPEKADFQRAESISKKLAAINQRRSARGLPEKWPGSPISADSNLGKSKKHVPQKIKDEDSELPKESLRRRNLGLGMLMSEDPTFPATPDMSEHDSAPPGRTRPIASSFFEMHIHLAQG